MRYILQTAFANQIPYRLKYLFNCFKLYFKIASPKSKYFIELSSIPPTALDCLIIYGHNKFVKHYFLQMKAHIPEQDIIIITCETGISIKELCLQNHTVFLSKQNLNQCSLLLDGPTYNMDFNPTESELLLYNSSKNKDFHSRLKDSFDLISL